MLYNIVYVQTLYCRVTTLELYFRDFLSPGTGRKKIAEIKPKRGAQ
jgi:hypothetical protein